MRNSSESGHREHGAVRHLYGDLWRLLRGRRHVFAGAVLLLIGAQLVLLSVPYLSGRALNTLQLQGAAGFSEAGGWLMSALLVACASWLLHGPARILERNSALTVRQRMSSQLITKLFELPLRWHEARHSGATAHRVQQSAQALSNFAQSQFIYLSSAVRLAGPLAALCWLDRTVGVAAMVGFALIVLSVAGFDRAMLRLAKEENQAERRYSTMLIDSLSNAGTIYALRQMRNVAARVERRLLEAFVPLRKAIVLNEAKWFTVDLATRTLNCLLVVLFVWLAARKNLDAGKPRTLMLGSLYMVWEYAQQASGVIASIASHFQTFARQHADYASADVIRHEVTNPARRAPQLDGAKWTRVEISDLVFLHTDRRHDGAGGLHGVALTLERGKRYALIGGSGSGKSTLLKILAGLYTAERISLVLDGRPARTEPAESAQILRAATTLIPQDAQLCEGTLEENLSLGESILGVQAAGTHAAALRAACATEFIEPSPSGMQLHISERAANWSGGQRNRVALACGINAAAGSGLVLMDEPTANLDPSTESRVYANLFETFSNSCVVSTIHRLNMLGEFDEVLVMRGGSLISQGSPDQLALSCAEFRRLSNLAGQDVLGSVKPTDARHAPYPPTPERRSQAYS